MSSRQEGSTNMLSFNTDDGIWRATIRKCWIYGTF